MELHMSFYKILQIYQRIKKKKNTGNNILDLFELKMFMKTKHFSNTIIQRPKCSYLKTILIKIYLITKLSHWLFREGCLSLLSNKGYYPVEYIFTTYFLICGYSTSP